MELRKYSKNGNWGTSSFPCWVQCSITGQCHEIFYSFFNWLINCTVLYLGTSKHYLSNNFDFANIFEKCMCPHSLCGHGNDYIDINVKFLRFLNYWPSTYGAYSFWLRRHAKFVNFAIEYILESEKVRETCLPV